MTGRLDAPGHKTDDRPLRVAIAGCHRMLARPAGSHNFAADFAAVPETEVVAVFDRGADARRDFVGCWGDVWGSIAAFDDFGRMMEAVRPDIVCISTRQTMHAEQFDLALAAGVRGILCDKPLATSLAEADHMLAACRRAGVPLAFGLQRRWSRTYRPLQQVVADGGVGAVRGAIAFGLQNLINHGPHWYDMLLALIGDPEPTWVSALVEDRPGEAPDSPRRLDPTGWVQVGLASGAVAQVTPAGPPGLSFEVLGDRGRLLIVDDARAAFLWAKGTSATGSPQPLELPAQEGYSAGPAMVRDLVRAVRTGSATACDVEEARRATEIGFAAHVSSASGGARVALPAADRSLRIESLPWGNE